MIPKKSRLANGGETLLMKRYIAAALLSAISMNALALALAPVSAAPAARHAEQPDPYTTDGKSGAVESARRSLLDTFTERKAMYDNIATLTGIPWYNLAAIDQYERTLSIAHPKTRPLREGLIAIYMPEVKWVGMMNPDHDDKNLRSILYFDGFGRDGDGDGKADRGNDADLLYSIAHFLLQYGTSSADFNIGLWEYYQNSRSVERINQFARIYGKFGTLDLHRHAFPLPLGGEYSYRSTWGAARSYGGYRIHEGTDLFAHHGMPVRSTCYGIIEVMGWNRYGGWRVGIRDLNNVYHYYAHLSGFNKGLKEGDIVEPGAVIGWVGSSGYGKPGTQGKFPPHLHYGVYRDNGLTEWSFDPYPYLRKWEREERKRKKKR
jgi:murein DD-endopeptidase MepM/ murein hydrolase activator NlpD